MPKPALSPARVMVSMPSQLKCTSLFSIRTTPAGDSCIESVPAMETPIGLGKRWLYRIQRQVQTPPSTDYQGEWMTRLEAVIDELVTANRILAREGIVDSFGHPSIRHPERPDRFLISRARAPDLIETADIMEITLNGAVIGSDDRKPYLERFIHGAVYEARPEVKAVIHNHSPSVLPFGVTKKKLKPLHHMC